MLFKTICIWIALWMLLRAPSLARNAVEFQKNAFGADVDERFFVWVYRVGSICVVAFCVRELLSA